MHRVPLCVLTHTVPCLEERSRTHAIGFVDQMDFFRPDAQMGHGAERVFEPETQRPLLQWLSQYRGRGGWWECARCHQPQRGLKDLQSELVASEAIER